MRRCSRTLQLILQFYDLTKMRQNGSGDVLPINNSPPTRKGHREAKGDYVPATFPAALRAKGIRAWDVMVYH